MKTVKTVVPVVAAIMLLCLGGIAQANVFNEGLGLTNLETVLVGDAGNTGDTVVMQQDSTTGYGAVAYNYSIGKYEVTTAQYCDFLNHVATMSDPYGLYNSFMGSDLTYGCRIEQNPGTAGNPYSYSVVSGYENRPVNYVSFWDACRFANWVGNGQGNGNTEDGAYSFNGVANPSNGSITRNSNWTWAVTSEDEWYKAAYYKGGSLNAGYWDYPTQSPAIYTTMANYNWTPGHRTDVGSYAYPGAYGTYDQAGNVWELNEAVINYISRGLRGGSFMNGDYIIPSSYRFPGYSPTGETYAIGFRLSGVPTPEPTSLLALTGGLATFGLIRRRRKI